MRKIELETIVPKELEGKRLDLVLSKLFPKYSRSKIQSWIKAGEVTVNDSDYKQRSAVNYGDIIKINTIFRSIVKDRAEPIELI
jgi:Pseudouridylate synthases, 23S RNA-specific